MEIKFGTDTFEKPQRDAYTEIAGDRTKVKVLDPDECGCNSDDDGKKSTVTEWATAAVATLVALAQLRKGKIPKMPKIPIPCILIWRKRCTLKQKKITRHGLRHKKKAQLVAVYSPLKVEKIMLELFQPFVRFYILKEGFSDEMREAIALCLRIISSLPKII